MMPNDCLTQGKTLKLGLGYLVYLKGIPAF